MNLGKKFKRLEKEIRQDLDKRFDAHPSYREIQEQISYIQKRTAMLTDSDDDEIRLQIYDDIGSKLIFEMYDYPEYEREIYGLDEDYGKNDNFKDTISTSFWCHKSDY